MNITCMGTILKRYGTGLGTMVLSGPPRQGCLHWPWKTVTEQWGQARRQILKAAVGAAVGIVLGTPARRAFAQTGVFRKLREAPNASYRPSVRCRHGGRDARAEGRSEHVPVEGAQGTDSSGGAPDTFLPAGASACLSGVSIRRGGRLGSVALLRGLSAIQPAGVLWPTRVTSPAARMP